MKRQEARRALDPLTRAKREEKTRLQIRVALQSKFIILKEFDLWLKSLMFHLQGRSKYNEEERRLEEPQVFPHMQKKDLHFVAGLILKQQDNPNQEGRSPLFKDKCWVQHCLVISLDASKI